MLYGGAAAVALVVVALAVVMVGPSRPPSAPPAATSLTQTRNRLLFRLAAPRTHRHVVRHGARPDARLVREFLDTDEEEATMLPPPFSFPSASHRPVPHAAHAQLPMH
jgi:hypothetical protein